MKILLDTDIGTNIDDALCLTYLLKNPACDLLGITTVTGEAEKRASIASAICRYAGKEMPIYPGGEHPLCREQKQVYAEQEPILSNWIHTQHFSVDKAIPFMQETIRAHPGDVTLLSVGPLTNVARLFLADPEIPSLLRQMVLMCGVYSKSMRKIRPTETNAMTDPEAVQLVFEMSVQPLFVVGLDCTYNVHMPTSKVIKRLQTVEPSPLNDMLLLWQEGKEDTFFHDPLAAATLFEDFCQFSPGEFHIRFKGKDKPVETNWTKLEESNSYLAIEVNEVNFIEHFFSILSGLGDTNMRNPEFDI